MYKQDEDERKDCEKEERDCKKDCEGAFIKKFMYIALS
jgi:hypothetical protein